jgi:secondary thiamine-phosphate synthase enzyme
MRQATTILTVQTHGRGLREISDELGAWVAGAGLRVGLLTVFCRHTSASLLIQENAARAARQDLEAFFEQIAPEDPGRYRHNDEGPDDMPAHPRRPHRRQPDHPADRRPPVAGHVAGRLPLRTPDPRSPAGGGAASDRRVTRVRD